MPELKTGDSASECPLSAREQTRNVLLYSFNTGMIYLASPVIYVGIVHAALCEQMDASDTVANLPSTMYFAMSPMPILIAWLFPFVRSLKRVVVICFALAALMGALVALTVVLPTPNALKITALVV